MPDMPPPNWILLCAFGAVLAMAFAAGCLWQHHSMTAEVSAATLHGYRNGVFDTERRIRTELDRAARFRPGQAAVGAVTGSAPVTAPRHARDAARGVARDGNTAEFRRAPTHEGAVGAA